MLNYLLIALLSFTTLIKTSAQEKLNPFSSLIPQGFKILDSVSGDLNNDGLRDYAIILKNNLEEENRDTTRPLLILIQTPKKEFQLYARNDNVVLCKSCGGVFGDPLDGVFITNGILTIHHYGGSSWRWVRDIEFKYYIASKTFKLYKDSEFSYYAGNPKKTETRLNRKQDFGKLSFEKFNSNAQ